MPTTTYDRYRLIIAATLCALIIWAALAWAPGWGLAPPVARAVAMLLVALLLWAGSGLPQGLSAVIILLAFPLLGILDFDTTVASLGQPYVWLLLATFIFARIVDRTNLGRRIALGLLYLARGNSALMLLAVMVSATVTAFLLPTSSGRAALLAPICAGMVEVVRGATGSRPAEPGRTGNLARAMFIGVAFVSSFSGISVMTGSSAATYAAGIFPRLFTFSWDYGRWLATFAPTALLFIPLFWLGLLALFRPEFRVIPGGASYVIDQLRELGRPSRAEYQTLGWIMLMVAGWVTAPYHSLSVPMVAVMGAVGMVLPGVGVLDWRSATATVDWDVALQFCAGYSLALALERSGAAAWFAGVATGLIHRPTPLVAGLFMLLFVGLIRLAFVNMVAVMATVLPIAARLGTTWGINPVWLSLFAMVAVSFGFFLISQTPTNGIAYAYGHFTPADMMRAGFVAVLAAGAVTVLLAFTLWPLIGLRP